ncbi:Dolichyl-phosphate beta-glucosyltransferase [Penicillium brevicompactum]|uniref:dolichyl-phosphate beta-glucosyltransferase n=1 Tax=Penicillium brevicompactum TaxID=5074 RepID=A0A9W9URJ2_PENBR|nr:Dolichyl-phosphate beta-glucosyltransferase [Penicillium brevicompactum]
MAAWSEVCRQCVDTVVGVPIEILLVAILATLLGLLVLVILHLHLHRRARSTRPLPEEKKYRTLSKDGTVTTPESLPSWLDSSPTHTITPASLFMSVVIPAYNEEDRLTGMLEEAVNYLERMYGTALSNERVLRNRKLETESSPDRGWEILLVSDGSTDSTEDVAFRFARDHQLSMHPKGHAGPWTPQVAEGVHIPPGTIRVVNLTHNRGKGGAVTHGMRHVRGQYVVFADADGASKFDDLGKLVGACREVEDGKGRAVAVGSRAHMVGSEAVVKRSKLRNFLMHSFHLILWLMTPPKTATVKDTQCGFKLFSRSALPYIVPYMHSEGWIFDVEMLMLAEFAKIPVAEVPVGWREVKGSKLNVLRDSIGMAWGLAVLRAAWSLGVYRQR